MAAAPPPPPPPPSSTHRRVVSAVESYASYSSESDDPDRCDPETLDHRRASIHTLSDDDDPHSSGLNASALSAPSPVNRTPDRSMGLLTAIPSLTERLEAHLGLDTSFGLAEFAASSDSGSDSGYASSYSTGAASASSAIPHATLAEFASASTSDASTSTGIASISHRRHISYEDEDENEDDGEADVDDLLSNDTSCMPIGILPEDCTNGSAKPPSSSKSSSSAMISTLKKRWRGVKRAGVKGTTSAGKSLSSLSKSKFSSSREPSETREDRHSRLSEEWLSSILPAWQKKRKTHRVRTLVFRGIPVNVRREVWICAIGNPLNVSNQLFDVLKERAYAGRMEYLRHRETVQYADGEGDGEGDCPEPHMENERSAHKAISLDLPRTFPELTFFHAEGTHYEFAMRDVLEAFLYLKPDIGYSQGMSFVAATLLLYMDPYEAFTCFVTMLLHKSCFLHFFRIQMPEVSFYLTVHERLLAEELPALYTHFVEHGVESNLYMINWVMSFYCRALPLDLVTRIWDLYVLDGDIAIFRAAIGILRLFCSKLLKMKFEEMAYFLSHIPGDEIEPDELLQSIRSVRAVTRKRFRMLFKECQAEHKKGEQQPVADGNAKPTKVTK